MQTPVAVHGPVDAVARLSWRRLLVVTAVLDAVAILVIAAVLSDIEALAIGMGFMFSAALLRWRRGLAGRILLGLLFVDVLVWMAMGLVTNIGAGEALTAVAMPAVLTGISATGLIATVAERRVTTPWAPAAAALVGAAIIVASGAAALVSPAAPATAAATDVRVVSEDVTFDMAALDVAAGEVTVELANRDLFWHTFTIDELGVDLAVPVSGDRQVTFEAAPGTYRFYCRIPGHEGRMAGTLTVR